MNASGAAILTNPHPCGHIVYPYTDENRVERAVGLFASAGLREREGVILIMSSEHSQPIKLRLQSEGIDVQACESSDQLICVTAEYFLSQFVVDGTVDEDVFKLEVGRLIDRARGSVSDGHPAKVRVFGEMVSQLRNSNPIATTRLEELWNDVIHEHAVSLLCTYSLHDANDCVPQEMLTPHSHNLEQE
jgi:hypothetical protein